MDTTDALLQAVLANPGDDAPRLIWADWLEERDGPGDAERAEFVRVQCELARRVRGTGSFGMCKPGHGPDCQCTLRRRERELLKAHAPDWLPGEIDWRQVQWRRGFVEEVACPLETWAGGVCEGCHNSDSHGFAGHGNWRRFECPHCSGSGWVAGVGAALVKCQPVTRVVCAEKRPLRGESSPIARWTHDSRKEAESLSWQLPAAVFKLLPTGPGHNCVLLRDEGEHRYRFSVRDYDTEEAANIALSDALLALAKS